MSNAQTNQIDKLLALHKRYRNTGDGYAEELADVAKELLTALKAMVENPRPATASCLNPVEWQKRYQQYSDAFDKAAELVGRIEEECGA